MELTSYFDMVDKILFQDFNVNDLDKALDGDKKIIDTLLAKWDKDSLQEDEEEELIDVLKMIALKYMVFHFDEEEDFLAPVILHSEPEEFALIALEDENLLTMLIENEITCYSTEEPFPYELLDCFLRQPLESDLYPTGLDLYKAYHPFLNQENKVYAQYLKNKKVQEKMMDYPLEHFLSFYLFGNTYLANGGSTFETVQILSDKLEDLSKKNHPMYEACTKDLLMTYYVIYKSKMNKEQVNSTITHLVEDMEWMDDKNLFALVESDEDTRKLLFQGILQDFDLMTYKETEQQVESYQKVFSNKFQKKKPATM